MGLASAIKHATAQQLSRVLVRALARDRSALNQLLANAVKLQLARISDEEFRRHLEEFYAASRPAELSAEVELAAKKAKLNQPGAYKVDIVRLASDANARHGLLDTFGIWSRRLAILRHLRIRCDVLVLAGDKQVPPHGHHQVVSGFYVLEGAVGIRHYDVISANSTGLLVRKSLDIIAEPGGFGTNSECHHNVHWLCGMAPLSYLFRISLTGVPLQRGRTRASANDRIYVDPTADPADDGSIPAPFISESAAKKLSFSLVRA